jgi:hypothetical protein
LKLEELPAAQHLRVNGMQSLESLLKAYVEATNEQ